MTDVTNYRLLDAGERALVVEFGATVDPAINGQVLALDAAFVAARIEGVRETVPTYRSLMIHYDPLIASREKLVARIADFEAAHPAAPAPQARWIFPCCYDPAIAEDIAELAALVKLDVAEAARIHASGAYRAYMYGFAPGYCYLGGLPETLAVSRRATDAGVPCSFHPNSPETSTNRTEEDYSVILEGLDSSVTGWTPDVGHIINGGMDPLAKMKQYSGLINHVHYKDWDGNPEFALMGEGKVDFFSITRWLSEQDYGGWIICEDEAPQAVDDPDGVTLHDGRWIKEILIPSIAT